MYSRNNRLYAPTAIKNKKRCWRRVPTWYAAVRPAPAAQALKPPPVSKHVRQICGNFWMFLTFGDLDLWPLQLQIGTSPTRPWGKFIPILIFFRFFCFRITSPYWRDYRRTDRQTDGRTDGRSRRVMRPSKRPHNKALQQNVIGSKMPSIHRMNFCCQLTCQNWTTAMWYASILDPGSIQLIV